jgi:hypothetical protein
LFDFDEEADGALKLSLVEAFGDAPEFRFLKAASRLPLLLVA